MRAGGHGLRAAVAAGIVLVAALTAGARDVLPTLAFWTDSATAVTGSLTAHNVPTPSATGCNVTGNALTGFTATIQWAPNAGAAAPYGYTAVLRQTGQSLTITTNAGGNRQVQVSSGLLGSLFGTTVHVDIRTTIPGTTWLSALRRTRAVVVGVGGLSMSCGGDSTSSP